MCLAMDYLRVLPRDAFNEAKLLKCIGKLTLLIEDGFAADWSYEYDNGPFNIAQSQGDGSIEVTNVRCFFRGKETRLSGSLNCRALWPLQDDEGIRVFDDEGRYAYKLPEGEVHDKRKST